MDKCAQYRNPRLHTSTVKKSDNAFIDIATVMIRVTPKDAMKLRLTGFECFRSFVIHRAKHTHSSCGPPLERKACLGISYNLMSFPIYLGATRCLAHHCTDKDNTLKSILQVFIC